MLKQTSSLALTGLLLLPTLAAAYTQARARSKDTDPRLTEKVGAKVGAICTGARVPVTGRDRQKLTGYVAVLGPQEFVLTMAREGTKVSVAYGEAGEVRISNEKRHSTMGKFLNVFGVRGMLGAVGDGGG